MLAATVWPVSTARDTTMPSIGEVMTVCSRFTLAWFRLAFDCATDASADRTCASADASATWADSRSASDTSCFSASLAVRSSASLAASRATFEPLDVGLGPDQVRLRLLDLRLEQRRIEPGEHLALPNDVVEVGVQRLDDAGHLAADVDRRHGLERPGGADGLHEVAPGHLDRRHLGLRLATRLASPRPRPPVAMSPTEANIHMHRSVCVSWPHPPAPRSTVLRRSLRHSRRKTVKVP